ncbi:IclR family transcriptional regulator [Aureimonas fodinaquatilis]|uniref:IclR family transcriptional regulator n=1 Tax=Aureimonas fodinaquatilis TaxID=2565783 RepID=A0A5B0E023_9HYPH|nr:IclR family transcriptional regulator [Aureimonas fodinaquatilis]KAA0971978.1 IclR family transcriptional regulator [Aureimonas fodinaquatilis]
MGKDEIDLVETDAAPSYAAPAVDKAFDIIDLVAGEIDGLTVTDIALRLGRSTSQIYRIVVSLHRLGFLRRNEQTDRYELALKLYELATRHPPLQRLIHHANPVLAALSDDTDQSCHLASITGTSLVILAQADSPMPMHYTVKLGSRFPAMETSSGVVIGAFSSPNRQQILLADFSAEEQKQFRARFDAIARDGYERRDSEVTAGVINLSKPVFDAAGQPVAAVTVLFLPQRRMRFELDAVLEKVLAAADELTRIMQNA